MGEETTMGNELRLYATCLTLFAAVALPAGAADIKPTSPGVLKAAPAPLKSPMKLDQDSLRVKKIEQMPQRDELDRTYDDFRRKYDATLAAIGRFEKRSAECMARTYSVEDQRSAGCTLSDSVYQCNQKLFNRCAGDVERAQYTTWTEMQMSAASLRKKVLRFSNDPKERP
jgi:hypothetical protein